MNESFKMSTLLQKQCQVFVHKIEKKTSIGKKKKKSMNALDKPKYRLVYNWY